MKRLLPSGYKYTDGSQIQADEVAELWRQAEHVYGTSDSALIKWGGVLQAALLILGVRDSNRNLVGVGSVTGDTWLSWLDNLAVHPQHQHRGIGRTIVRERIKIADSMDVQVLATSLTSRNTLKPLYLQLGFKALDSGGYTLERDARNLI